MVFGWAQDGFIFLQLNSQWHRQSVKLWAVYPKKGLWTRRRSKPQVTRFLRLENAYINETLFGLSIPSRLTKSIRRKRWVRVEWGWGVKPTSAGSRFPSRTHTNPIHGWRTPNVIRAKRQSNGKAFKPLGLWTPATFGGKYRIGSRSKNYVSYRFIQGIHIGNPV